MIHGIGTDLVEVARVRALLERHGVRAARRILADTEMKEFSATQQPERFLARRFAAKEAFAKALGTGVRAPATLHGMAVAHDALGKPVFQYSPALQALMRERGLAAHLSLSDEVHYALAFVVIEETQRDGG